MTRTIKVSDENWSNLNGMKEPADTFDDVVTRLIEDSEELQEMKNNDN